MNISTQIRNRIYCQCESASVTQFDRIRLVIRKPWVRSPSGQAMFFVDFSAVIPLPHPILAPFR